MTPGTAGARVTGHRPTTRRSGNRPGAPARWHTRPGWWQHRAAANAALAVREFVVRTARGTGTDAGEPGGSASPDELLVALSAGLAAVLDLHHPDEHGTCAACSPLPAPWRWLVRVRWPCPLLRTLTRELDHTITETRQ